jgi:hypothetical protein
MDLLERVLREQTHELIDVLTFDAGMSRTQAEVFLREAGPALVDSYRWQASVLEEEGLSTPAAVRDLLAGINGRRLAPKVGLPTERTWDALRALVPAVVRSTAADGEGGDNGSGRSHPLFGYLLSSA